MINLEKVLRTPNTVDVIDAAVEVHSILKEPMLYISPTDKLFDTFMDKLGEHNRGDLNISVKPLFDSTDEVDGIYVSFNIVL